MIIQSALPSPVPLRTPVSKDKAPIILRQRKQDLTHSKTVRERIKNRFLSSSKNLIKTQIGLGKMWRGSVTRQGWRNTQCTSGPGIRRRGLSTSQRSTTSSQSVAHLRPRKVQPQNSRLNLRFSNSWRQMLWRWRVRHRLNLYQMEVRRRGRVQRALKVVPVVLFLNHLLRASTALDQDHRVKASNDPFINLTKILYY